MTKNDFEEIKELIERLRTFDFGAEEIKFFFSQMTFQDGYSQCIKDVLAVITAFADECFREEKSNDQ